MLLAVAHCKQTLLRLCSGFADSLPRYALAHCGAGVGTPPKLTGKVRDWRKNASTTIAIDSTQIGSRSCARRGQPR